jgi:hypothetical protein
MRERGRDEKDYPKSDADMPREPRRLNSFDPFSRELLIPALIARSNVAPAFSRSADMRLSHITDELLVQFGLYRCASPGPPQTLVSPLPTIASVPVRPDCF